MANLKLKGINKCYENGVKAVNDFNLDIEDKEFIVFVGPSGCGKSTTLRMIAGLEEISSGELYIGEKLMNNVEPKDRDIAMVFQNYALYPHMTVYNNMAFGLKKRKMSKEEIEKRVLEAAKILDIEHLLDRKPKALSGGQRQRVAMGRAIVRDAQVFLMDEPLSNLDAKLRGQMRVEISKLYQRLQTTFIYVTHDQTEAMTLGTRIVVMKDGVIQQIDTPQNIYKNPANMFVAQFIGTPQMNFLYGKVNENELEIFDKKMILDIEQVKKIKEKTDEKDILVGIRPENILLGKIEGKNGVTFEGEIELVENLGSDIYVHIKVKDKTVIIKAGSEFIGSVREKIDISIVNNKMHLFTNEQTTIF